MAPGDKSLNFAVFSIHDELIGPLGILENIAVCQKLSIIKRFFATIISHKFFIMDKMNANFFQEMMEDLRVQPAFPSIT